MSEEKQENITTNWSCEKKEEDEDEEINLTTKNEKRAEHLILAVGVYKLITRKPSNVPNDWETKMKSM